MELALLEVGDNVFYWVGDDAEGIGTAPNHRLGIGYNVGLGLLSVYEVLDTTIPSKQ